MSEREKKRARYIEEVLCVRVCARQAKAGAAQDAGGGKRKGMVDASGKYNPYTPQRQRAVWQIAGSVMKKLGYGPFYTP